GTTLTETIRDTSTMASFTTSYTVNIPAIVGSDTAYVGFGGGTGGLNALHDILTWTYTEQETNLPPRRPSNLQITSVDPDGNQSDVTIVWKCNNAYTAQGFSLERSTDGINFTEIAASNTSFTTYIDGPLADGTYYYRVRSFNDQGYSAYSNV